MTPALPLYGKVALVTGASRGIGAAIAKLLASDGASVVVNYVSNEGKANEVVNAIVAEGKGKAVALRADISSVAEGNKLVEDSVQAFGGLDILVHNAAYKKLGKLGDVDEKQYDDHFNANVKAPIFMTRTAAKYLKSGGRVIFISSSGTKSSAVTPDYLLYGATKGATDQLVRVLAKELGAKGINVNAVAPGPVDTDFFRDDGKTKEFIQLCANLHPQKRIPGPDEIAPLVAFLAKDEASWVNGQFIMVNGGMAV